MAVTKLKRKAFRKKRNVTWRKNVHKHLTKKPVLKKSTTTQDQSAHSLA